MNYDDYLYIPGGTSGGNQDGDGGWDPGTEDPEPKYDDKCDAQEKSSGGLKITTTDTEVTTETADLEIYLKDEDKITNLEVDDQGTLTRFGNDYQIVITNVRLIDGMIEANTI